MSLQSIMRDVERTHQALDRVAKRAVATGYRRTLNRAATPLLQTAKSLAPNRTGTLRKGLKKQAEVKLNEGIATARVGAGKAKIRGRSPARYLHLVEKGFKARNGSLVAGSNFLTRAAAASKEACLQVLRRDLANDIDTQVARAAQRRRARR